MIHYQLKCPAGHAFDGWFRNSAAFDDQSNSGALQCPVCGATGIVKALMAPRIGRGTGHPVPAETPPAEPAVASPVPSSTPAQIPALALRAALQQVRRVIETECENMGDQFAKEARKIHEGEAEARPIYGQATPEETEALVDDGIAVGRIPWVPLNDS